MVQDATVLVILTIKAPKTAAQKTETQKLSSSAATSPNIAAFRTKINRPSVIIASGRVSTNMIGRVTPLTSPSSTAAKTKVKAPLIQTPEIRYDARSSPSIQINVRIIMPFIRSLWHY